LPRAALTVLFLGVAAALTSIGAYLTGSTPQVMPEAGSGTGFALVLKTLALTITAALFEEALYRVYLTERLRYFRVPEYCAYALSIVLFALAHRSYGVFGIVNALVAGATLQWCYRSTGSVTAIAAAHSVYNLALQAIVLLHR
jgi:membrane protease YdiL (CAAX protease family)